MYAHLPLCDSGLNELGVSIIERNRLRERSPAVLWVTQPATVYGKLHKMASG
jgi:hypothetical protein